MPDVISPLGSAAPGYIADSGAKAIFRYSLVPVLSGTAPSLTTSGVRLTVSKGHPVESVTIDDDGNLFYTNPDTNNINKIAAKVLEEIGHGAIKASDLQIISEKTMEAQLLVSSLRTKKKPAQNTLPVDLPPPRPYILSYYEARLNPRVSKPASLLADGKDLFWVNQKDGTTAGTIVKGEVNPKAVISTAGPQPFPAVALTNISDSAYGIGKTDKVVFFTRNGKEPYLGVLSALKLGTDIIIDLSKDLQGPRGLVWDRDNTMYVADETTGIIWSFPSGRLMANVPLAKVVHMQGAYGLAVFSSEDPGWHANQRQPTGSHSNCSSGRSYVWLHCAGR